MEIKHLDANRVQINVEMLQSLMRILVITTQVAVAANGSKEYIFHNGV